MGMYDELWWEADVPVGHPPDSRLFQTKSFDCCLDRYVVTEAGRLCLVGNGWQDDGPFQPESSRRRIDVEFHGDMRLVPVGGPDGDYIARFTHGTLEWIRPSADVPKVRWNFHALETPPD